MRKKIVAVILAAGKGTRMNAKKINKVMYPLAGKPMIGYTVDLLKKVGFKKIVVVVGFAKRSVMDFLGKNYVYAEQKKRLGTAHALKCAFPFIPVETEDIFVCSADDTAFYPPRVIKNLLNFHFRNNLEITLLTVIKDNPTGLGRIIRDKEGKIRKIVEDKNATEEEKKIKEINTGCYCFKTSFLKKYLPMIKKDFIKKEYYLTDIVRLAIENGRKIGSLLMSKSDYFQGINTREELKKAEEKMFKIKRINFND